MAAQCPPVGRLFIYLLAFVMLPAAVHEATGRTVVLPLLGTTYHVANGGNDNNDGSAAHPWATLQHAADQVQAGDSVLVHPGSYTGFQIETSGTTALPIVFKAVGSGVVVNAVNPVRGNDNINVEGADYVVIEGFRVRDADRAGVRVVIARGVVVKNNVVGPNGKWGIFTGFAHEVQILNNETFGSADEHGIYVSNSDVAGDNPVIRGNVSHDNHTNGIQLNGDCFAGGDGVIEGAVIENNVVHDNNAKGFSLISIAGSVVRNNVIYDNGISAGAGGIHLVDEPGCGNPTVNTVVVNNTIVEPRIAGIRINDGATNNVIFNNLIVSDRPIRDEVGGNLIDAVSNLAFSATAGLFADAASGDYHLASNSAAIDAGVASYKSKAAPANDFDGNARPTGTTWDAGAYEHTGQGPGPAFTITPKKRFRTATGKKRAKIKWTVADVPSRKIDFYVDRTPDGIPDTRTANDGEVKLKIKLPGDGPFAVQACRKNSTTFCSNVLTIDYNGVPLDLSEPDDDEDTTDDETTSTTVFTFRGVYPNPFNPVTTLSFDLTEDATVHVEVYDLLGRRVLATPTRHLQAGTHLHEQIDASAQASGMYFYRVIAQTQHETQVATGRMVLAK